MKKLTAALAATTMALSMGAANAADLGGSEKYETPSFSKKAFSGWYGGVQGGGQFTNIDVYDQFDGIGADGLAGGVHVGYNMALGSIVTGPYMEAALSNVNVVVFGTDVLRQDWYVNAGWTLGVKASEKTLVFGRVGYEYAAWSSDVSDSDADVYSYVIGGGIDTMVSDHVSFGITADYVIPNQITVDGDTYTEMLDASESLRVMGRLTYRQ